MNYFEAELRKLFGDGQLMDDPAFSGRICMGTLGEDVRVRVQFISSVISSQYDALKIFVLNRTEGAIDTHVLKFRDVLGKKAVPNNPYFREGVYPYIWDDHGKAQWYAYQPDQADRDAIRKAVGLYLEVFRDRQAEQARTGPKLVYICAPLRGEVEQNIEFARQKAREVFQAGDIPVCPHLMFPSFADPADPVQDQQAREAGLRLVESCQQINVYGPVWTDGMWAEINHANRLGIPVMTDQKTIGRPPRRTRQSQSAKRQPQR